MIEEVKVDSTFVRAMEEFRKPNKEVALLQACSENVVVFASHMLGLKLYSWQVLFLNRIQKALVDDKITREFLAITSRQIGKSTSIAIFALWCCVFNKYPGTVSNNSSIGIASASDEQAKKLLNEIKKFIRLGDAFMKVTYVDDEGKPVFAHNEQDKKGFFSLLLDPNEHNNTTTITFLSWSEDKHGVLLNGSKSGSTIKSYPATSKVLGETFSVVIIDEAGKTDKITDEFFYEFMYPTGNSTNAIRIYTSTPWVPSGFFYRMVDPDNMYPDSSSDCVLFTVDAIKLENPKYYETVMKTVNELNRDGKTDEVQRAYYCRFVKGEMSYFNPEKVFSAFTNSYNMVDESNIMCDMGVDFGGQVKSRTVITISCMDDDGLIKRLYHRVYEVGKDKYLLDDIAELLKHFNIQRIVVDDCPAGMYMIREMEDKGWNVTRMGFRAEKVAKYGAFRSELNKNNILSYEDDKLKTEMLAMEFSNSSKQSVIQHAPNYSDDMIDSFVMSCYHFVQEDNTFKIIDPYEQEDDTVVCKDCGSDRVFRTVVKKKLVFRCLDCSMEWVSNVYD